ncbi:MAG: riboflavin synthase [Bacteroidetes bacterium]|nr:MAG: riboflavin synthase [Bacteroidota bacterium]
MFTGIIEEKGVIKSIRTGGRSSRMVISAAKILEDLKIGDSINTDGVCLTVTEFSSSSFTVDMMPETMLRSTFGKLKPGSTVNLERALRLSDRLGGHIVSGHIDGTGRLEKIRKDENAIWLSIVAEEPVLRYIVEKGSVAIDGISLTIAKVDRRTFEVSVIPHTQAETTILAKKTGDAVNIECDIIGKYIEKLGSSGKGKIDIDFLAENGFV